MSPHKVAFRPVQSKINYLKLTVITNLKLVSCLQTDRQSGQLSLSMSCAQAVLEKR